MIAPGRLPRVAVLALAGALPAAAAHAQPTKMRFPAAGGVSWAAIAVRAAPDPAAPRIRVLEEFRRDYRPQVVFAVGQRRGVDGRVWYRISLAMRPNGRTGWVPAEGVDVKPVSKRIVVRRGARRLEVYRGVRLLFRTTVAVGAPGTETPLGHFYVTAEFRPTDPFYGTHAFETSAYSPTLTDWPGGGIVGIHGTSKPWLLGQAVSHGCVRISNAAADRLAALVDPGTPVAIVP